MPEVYRFSKPEIVIQIYPREPKHHKPHFHAQFQGKSMSISIDDPVKMNGYLPPNAERIVFPWARENQEFLRCAWDAVMAGKKPPKLK
jgi:hypothetical protein